MDIVRVRGKLGLSRKNWPNLNIQQFIKNWTKKPFFDHQQNKNKSVQSKIQQIIQNLKTCLTQRITQKKSHRMVFNNENEMILLKQLNETAFMNGNKMKIIFFVLHFVVITLNMNSFAQRRRRRRERK